MFYRIINKLNLRRNWPAVVLVVIFGWLFYSLLLSHMIYPKPDGLYSGGSTWGDLAWHLTLVNNFVERGIFLHQDPTFFGEKLSYPPFMDMLSAILVKLGMSLRWALILPTLILAVLSVVLLYILSCKINKSRLAGFLTPFFFFFNGSIVGFKYIFTDYIRRRSQEADFNIRFTNVIADYVLPQRTFVAGLFLGLVAVYFLWRYWESREKKQLLYSGVAISFLPFVHTHTFVALIFVAGFLAIIQLLENIKGFRVLIGDWIYFALPVILIGLPQFLYLFPWGSQHFTRFYFGWMRGNDSILVFWMKNLSPHIFIFIPAFIFAGKKLKKFVLAFLCLFVLTNLFIFQPHDYDNMKLMLWFFLVLSVLFGGFVGRIFEKPGHLRGALIAWPIILSLVLVGSSRVYGEYYLSWQMFSNEDVALADFVKKNTPKESLFLTTDQFNHPIPTLAGRQILMGYREWLWTHGLDYENRLADISEMLKGGPAAKDLILKYGVDYAVTDKNKFADFYINSDFFKKNYPQVYESANYGVYKLN